ncbi:hypothetical protein CRG98_024517 [Punica granatum]|uniref:GDSL esterase/lipase At5g45910-like n=1 Tax=Punica granatum TaxID=22663 RepID=A0A2I0JHY8_PUNGR|nr:hypothetical protein CRG98_024517 [Punica granatum]
MRIILLVLCCLASKGVSKGLSNSYDAIYNFGDGESDTECDGYFKKSLFLVGEIGEVDYSFPLLMNGDIQLAKTIVSPVVKRITDATRTLIQEGAVEVVVAGLLPMGCCPASMTSLLTFANSDNDFEETRCLKAPNEIARYHNKQLQLSLQTLSKDFPLAKIIYADYFNAGMLLYKRPQDFEFCSETLTACCGGGGPFNVNVSSWCGSPGSTVYPRPATFISWDGIHLTDAANGIIAKIIGRAFGEWHKLPSETMRSRVRSSSVGLPYCFI